MASRLEPGMLAPFVMGLVGGQRAITPIATVAVAAARGELPEDNGAPEILAHPLVAAALLALAIGEYAGDQQKTAPDRIIPAGLTARFVTSAVAGAALSSRSQRWGGAAVAGATAVIAAFAGWRLRMLATPRLGQALSGFVEDAVVLAAAVGVVRTHDHGPRLAGARSR